MNQVLYLSKKRNIVSSSWTQRKSLFKTFKQSNAPHWSDNSQPWICWHQGIITQTRVCWQLPPLRFTCPPTRADSQSRWSCNRLPHHLPPPQHTHPSPRLCTHCSLLPTRDILYKTPPPRSQISIISETCSAFRRPPQSISTDSVTSISQYMHWTSC